MGRGNFPPLYYFCIGSDKLKYISKNGIKDTLFGLGSFELSPNCPQEIPETVYNTWKARGYDVAPCVETSAPQGELVLEDMDYNDVVKLAKSKGIVIKRGTNKATLIKSIREV